MNYDDTTDKSVGLLSNCANLKNLTLNNCRIPGGRSKDLHLCHLGLSNLTLEDGGYNAVYVDTPQLKKFTIINWPGISLVSAPNLASLRYKDDTNNYFGNPLKVSSNLLHLDKAPMESQTATMHEQVEVENERTFPDTKIKWLFGERMTHIESYWEGLNEQYENGYENTGRTISMVRDIEGVLTQLPASHRDKLQARFSGLCVEAEAIMDNVMDRMKIKCGKTPHCSNVSFMNLSHHHNNLLDKL
ncbi:putative leucine-rich repeat domain superfamily [Helianthus anomalus]